MSKKVESQFLKTGLNPFASQIKTFGDPVDSFNTVMLTKAPVNAVAATKDFTHFVVTSKVKGNIGNNISVTLVERESDGPIEVSVAPDTFDFVVTLEMDTDTTVSTGSDVVAALNAFEAFSNVAIATGTASVALTEVAKTKLSGGVDGTFAPSAGFYFVDQNFVYVAIKANEKSDSNWRRIAVGSAY